MNSPSDRAQLVPVGGGDPIPLPRSPLVIGRRETCDICLRFSNVSGRHAELVQQNGIWYIRDLGSTNGTRVNGQHVIQQKLLRPGDEIAISKRRYTIQYTLPPGHGFLPEEEDISIPLLEKAGLVKPPRERRPKDAEEDEAE